MAISEGSQILLAGATGFVGKEVLAALQIQCGLQITAPTRHPRRTGQSSTVRWIKGDLQDQDAVRAWCRRAGTIVHCASYVGGDDQLSSAINVGGTRNLVKAGIEEGVNRIIYVSTAAVYGSGPHLGVEEGNLEFRPESQISADRRNAEEMVLETGGIVVRPNLVYGAGDRWFIPGLIQLTRLCGTIDHGQAKVSAIPVGLLGELLASLALTGPGRIPGGTELHASLVGPISVRSILDSVSKVITPLPLSRNTQRDEALRVAVGHGFTPHQFFMVARDNWFASERIYHATSTPDPARGFRLSERSIAWYRGLPNAGSRNQVGRLHPTVCSAYRSRSR